MYKQLLNSESDCNINNDKYIINNYNNLLGERPVLDVGRVHNDILAWVFNIIKTKQAFKCVSEYRSFLIETISDYLISNYSELHNKKEISNFIYSVDELISSEANIIGNSILNKRSDFYYSTVNDIINSTYASNPEVFEKYVKDLINNVSYKLNYIELKSINAVSSIAIHSSYYWKENLNSWIAEYKKYNGGYTQSNLPAYMYADARAARDLGSMWVWGSSVLNAGYCAYCSARFIRTFGIG